MKDLFKEKAKDWDGNSRRQNLSKSIANCIIKNIDFSDQMQVLDFGAGTGLITSQLAPFVKKIVAVDVSESMLEKLSLKLELKDKVEVLCEDITKRSLGIKFDLIVSAMAMHHVEDVDNLLTQFSNHLNFGGMIALADLDLENGSFHSEGTTGVYHNGFDRNQLRLKLEKNGFSEIKFETAYTVESESGDYPIFLVCALKY